MVRISRSIEYALIALQDMSGEPDRRVTARELSTRHALPSGLLAKIMQRLAAAGIVASEQGANGGYRLARRAGELSLLELSEAVDGPAHFAACDATGSCDRSEQCTVSGVVHALSGRIVDLLSATTIGSLLDEQARIAERLPAEGVHR